MHVVAAAATDYDDHVRDMIEAVLFTAPGEWVNRRRLAADCCSLSLHRTAMNWRRLRNTLYKVRFSNGLEM